MKEHQQYENEVAWEPNSWAQLEGFVGRTQDGMIRLFLALQNVLLRLRGSTMKLHSMTKVYIPALCVLFFLGVPATSASADDRGFGFGKRVAGSYLIENLSIPAAGLADLQAMANLAADGGVIATDSDDFGLAATAPHSPKHGAWKKTGKRQIIIKVLEFAYDPVGNHNLTWTLEFTGNFENRRFDGGTGSLVAKLFPVPYLPGMHPLDPNAIPIFVAEGTFDFRRIVP